MKAIVSTAPGRRGPASRLRTLGPLRPRRGRSLASPRLAAGQTEDNLHQTKRAILDAAERLFAEQGFRAASLRNLTASAGVNLGAVNYHFASKEALILAVLRRRIRPLNETRLALLSAFEKEAGPHPVSVENILRALFQPVIEFALNKERSGRHFVRLIAQSLAEPGVFLQPLVQEEFAERNRRFHAAIARTLPNLSADEVHWRLHFVHGVILHTLANPHLLQFSSNGRCRLGSSESVMARIIKFCAAGLKASPNTGEGKYGRSKRTAR